MEGPMSNMNFSSVWPGHLCGLFLSFFCAFASADEYTDVSRLAREGKLSEALLKADQYIAIKPREPKMRFLRGVILRDSGKSAEAIATFHRLAEDFPELPEPYNNLAVLYASQSQFDKARSALESAIRTNPSYAIAHENLGDIYAKLASQAYNKALQLDVNNAGVPPKLDLIRELFNTGHSPHASMGVGAGRNTAHVQPRPPETASVKSVASNVDATVLAQGKGGYRLAQPNEARSKLQATTKESKESMALSTEQNNAQAKERQAVQRAVHAWAKAWEAKDVAAYLDFYSPQFSPSSQISRSQWAQERRMRISNKSTISVQLFNLQVTGAETTAFAKFKQVYKSGSLVVTSHKTLHWVKSGEHWLIVKETTGT